MNLKNRKLFCLVRLVNTSNQVRIIIPNSDDEQDNNKKPSPSKASGSSKRKLHFFDYMAALDTTVLTHFMLVTCVCCLL
jgi:hypothetical protein